MTADRSLADELKIVPIEHASERATLRRAYEFLPAQGIPVFMLANVNLGDRRVDLVIPCANSGSANCCRWHQVGMRPSVTTKKLGPLTPAWMTMPTDVFCVRCTAHGIASTTGKRRNNTPKPKLK